MNQKEKTPSTTVKQARTNKRQRTRRKPNVSYSMIEAKPSNIPLPVEDDDKKAMVVTWGTGNNYGYFLNFLFKKNPIHAGIIRAKTYFIVSGGLIYTGTDQEGYDRFFKNKKKNHTDKDLQGLIKDVSLDYEKSNMGCYKVIFTKVGERKYKKLERIAFETIRFEIILGDANAIFLTGNIKTSPNWLDNKSTIEMLKPYDPDDKEQRQCFVLFQEESGQSLDTVDSKDINPGVYPDPPYGGAITDIDTGIQIGTYNNSEIHNGFVLGSLLYLANGPIKDEQQKKRLERDISASSTGPTQAGRTLVFYGNGQDQKPEVIALNGNNLADRYTNTKDDSETSTLLGHSVVVPSLFGLQPDGSFNASELEVGYQIMKNNLFKTRQGELLSPLNWIMNVIAEVEGEISFGEVTLDLPKEVSQPQFQVNMGDKKDDDTILDRFRMMGTEKSTVKIIHSKPMDGKELSKEEMIADYRNEFTHLTDMQQRVLELINDGQGYNSIRKALDVSAVELARIYQDLAADNFITDSGDVTDSGKTQIAISEVASIEIMYEYRLRLNAPALVPGGETRDFCKELLRLDRLYTRQDINRISGVEGYDVFAYRGGWYHNPNSDRNEPGCRHEWAQVITFG